MKRVRIGRWDVERFQRAIHFTQIPDPKCPNCHGDGGWWDAGDGFGPEPVACDCTEGLRYIRIPYGRRPRLWLDEEVPF